MAESPQPLTLYMENIRGEEVALVIEAEDTFNTFLDKAKHILGYDVDINCITNNQPVSLDENIYTYLLKAEHIFQDSTLNSENFNDILEQSNEKDLMYILDDGTQICASQIQFDNDDPFVDLTSEEIPFVKYKDESTDENELPDNLEGITIRNFNIADSPITHWSYDSKGCFANSLPFNLVCNNVSNFEAQFDKYLESSTKTYTNLTDVTEDRSLVPDNFNYGNLKSDNEGFLTREDILNMFKDSPMSHIPYDDNNIEERGHIRKTDPSRIVHRKWTAKRLIDMDPCLEKHVCFICRKTVDNTQKLYFFDREDQMLHRCEQRKYNTQIKIICRQCLGENFKPSPLKSSNQSLNDDEYLIIHNNEQFIFQKTTTIDIKSSYRNIDSVKESVELVKVEIGSDGEIVTKSVDNDVKSDDVIIVKDEKKDSSSDVELVEPELDVDVDNIDDADEEIKEFLGKYQCDVDIKEFKCRFCLKEFKDLLEVIEHAEDHKHSTDDGSVFPCPLCDYGYANSKWLKGHLKAAHCNLKKESDTTKEELSKAIIEENKDNTNSPQYSPVAKRTRSAIKRNDIEKTNGKQEKQESKDSKEKDSKERDLKRKVEDSSDDDSIWIVHTGDDASEQLQNLIKATESKQEVNDLKKYKCYSCSQIFPSADSLSAHKCRKRRKQKGILNGESAVFVPSRDDFIKRAQGKPVPVGAMRDNDLLVMRPRKRKTRQPSDPQIVTCHNCNESFTSKVRLKFHMQFHEPTDLLTPDGHYVCAKCKNAKFSTETKLFDHVHFQHNRQKRWQCPVKGCGKTFFLRATLTKHSRTHTDTRRYVCVTCDKRFLDKQTLDEHGVTHLQIKPFQCHICEKKLTRRSRLRMHLRAHEEELSPALVLVCGTCCRAFRDHVEAQEHATKATECIDKFANDIKEEVEGEQLSPTSGIIRHSVRVVESPRPSTLIRKEIKYEESENLLSALDDVARNIIRVVNIEKAFRCEYCEDVFYIEEALNNHRSIHKGVKNPFICHICKGSFATYSRCTTHKTTHGFYKRSMTADRPEQRTGPASGGILGYGGFPVVKHFLCEDCNRSYLHWTYFQVHRRTKHANENFIFKCNQCELTFPSSWSATYHRKKMHNNVQDENGGFTKIMRENYRIPCRDCYEVLPNKVALYKHRQQKHCSETSTKEEQWPDQESLQTTICNQCDCKVQSVTALQRLNKSSTIGNHKPIHTGTRLWACPRCPKRFRVRSDLRTHSRLKHPSQLAVIEIEGTSCTPEEALHHLNINNISKDKVIEITMISFPKNSTNIVPNSMQALTLLKDWPKTRIACKSDTSIPPLGTSDTFETAYRGGSMAFIGPTITDAVPQDNNYLPLKEDGENLPTSNVNQDGALVETNQIVQPKTDDGMEVK